MKNIAVLTSGGDAPGMNNAIRAVVRSGLHHEMKTYGIYYGFEGLCENDIRELRRENVSRILSRGGTILGSARYPAFKELNVQKKAVANLREKGIDGLVLIGGDGTYRGAKDLADLGVRCIALPGTIDNDIASTDYSIGFFTALETAVSSIDKLRDTSFSHRRCSVVEIMGRHCGDLALYAGIAVGSEFIITPETGYDKQRTLDAVKQSYRDNKRHAVVVVTERILDIDVLAADIERHTGYETRATVLGHVQRGGSPVAFDRVLATEMAEYAVELLKKGANARAVGIRGMDIVDIDLDTALTMKKDVSKKRYGLVGRLVR